MCRPFSLITRRIIFITKNGYSDLVVMSAELHGKFARINRIDQANFESDIPIRQLMNNAGLKNSENRKNFF